MKIKIRLTFLLLTLSILLNAQINYYAPGLLNNNQERFDAFNFRDNQKDTSSVSNPKDHKWIKASIVPVSLVTAGLVMTWVPENTWFSKYSVRERITSAHPGFSTKIDNYLQFMPGVAVFSLKMAGVKSKSDLLNQGIILAKSQLLQMTVVQSLKVITHVQRPNGAGFHSMPSGHTAEAFQLAAMLDMEYRDVSPWISVGGYTVAAATGAFRMLNNKHWDSDVMVGAGIGIFSTKLVYLTHRYRWKMKNKYVLVPTIYPRGGGLLFALRL